MIISKSSSIYNQIEVSFCKSCRQSHPKSCSFITGYLGNPGVFIAPLIYYAFKLQSPGRGNYTGSESMLDVALNWLTETENLALVVAGFSFLAFICLGAKNHKLQRRILALEEARSTNGKFKNVRPILGLGPSRNLPSSSPTKMLLLLPIWPNAAART